MKKKIITVLLALFTSVSVFSDGYCGTWSYTDSKNNEVELYLSDDGYMNLSVHKELVQIHSEYEGDCIKRNFAGWKGEYKIDGNCIYFHASTFYEFLAEENGVMGYGIEGNIKICFDLEKDKITVTTPLKKVLPFSPEEVYDFPCPLTFRKKQ